MTPELSELGRIRELEWVVRGIVEGVITGRHRSPFRGFSVEYLDHRPYSPGDPIKSIDWKVFARTDRYQVKQFQDETNLRATLILDASRSMLYPETSHRRPSKMNMAQCGPRGFNGL